MTRNPESKETLISLERSREMNKVPIKIYRRIDSKLFMALWNYYLKHQENFTNFDDCIISLAIAKLDDIQRE